MLGVFLALLLVTSTVAIASATQDARFDQTTMRDHQGDVVSIPVTINGTDHATIHVGSRAVNYLVSVTVEDGDGDGSVVLEWNTYTAGSNDPGEGIWSVADGDDAVTSVDRIEGIGGGSPDATTLAAGDYPVNVTVNGTETDEATIIVEGRSTDGATLYTAPGNQFGNETAELDLTTTSSVALDDLAVLQVNASGLEGLLAAQDGASATARFESLIASDNATFNLTQQNPAENAQPLTLDRDASFGNGAFDVSHDADNDTLYVVMNETDLRFQEGSVPAEGGDRFEATFTIHAESGLVSTDQSVGPELEFVRRTISYDAVDGEIQVPPEESQTVSGSTSVAPGTNLTMEARAVGNDPFLKPGSAIVGGGGEWTTTFDMSDVPNDTEFTVTARGSSTVVDGLVTTRADEVSTEPSPSPTVTATSSPDGATQTATQSSTPQSGGGSETTTAPETTPSDDGTNGTPLLLVGLVVLVFGAGLAGGFWYRGL